MWLHSLLVYGKKTKIPKSGRVIVTYGRSMMAVVIAHSLAKRGVEVISADSVGMTASQFSKFTSGSFLYSDPNEDPKQFIKSLVDECRRLAPDDHRPYVLMPAFREARLLAENADAFEGIIDLAVPPIASISQVNPKQKLMKTAQGF